MKRLLKTLYEKWPEYLLEIFVLIIGIYGAFALEEWNENKKNKEAKIIMIQNISNEFEENLKQLKSILNHDRNSINACMRLLDLINTDIPLNHHELDSTVNLMYGLWSFDLTAEALRSAISSGQIHLINHSALKENLFSWEDKALDAREEEERQINNLLHNLPAFDDRARAINNIHEYDSRIPKSKFPSDYESLMKDPEFENFLANQLVFLLDTAAELEMLKSKILEILKQLSEEK